MTGRPLSLHNTSYQTHGYGGTGQFLRFRGVAVAALLALPLGLLACRPGAGGPSATGPTGATGTSPPAEPGAVTGGAPIGATGSPAAPQPVPVLFAVVRSGGSVTPLDPAGVTAPGASASFEVRAGAVLPGARLVLVDAQDQLVAGSADTEVGSDSRFTFTPSDPLRPGGSYLLRLEGLSGPAVTTPDGRSYLPASFPVQAPGTALRPSGGRRK